MTLLSLNTKLISKVFAYLIIFPWTYTLYYTKKLETVYHWIRHNSKPDFLTPLTHGSFPTCILQNRLPTFY